MSGAQVPLAVEFGETLAALKAGKRVARAGWNGKGMWLKLIKENEWSATIGAYGERSDNPHRLPWIAMKTTDGGLVPWLASQMDMLADDWTEIAR